MKKFFFFPLISIIAICSLVSFALLIDDDENAAALYSAVERYSLPSQQVLPPGSVLFGFCERTLPRRSIIAYLAQHEKSPPSPVS